MTMANATENGKFHPHDICETIQPISIKLKPVLRKTALESGDYTREKFDYDPITCMVWANIQFSQSRVAAICANLGGFPKFGGIRIPSEACRQESTMGLINLSLDELKTVTSQRPVFA